MLATSLAACAAYGPSQPWSARLLPAPDAYFDDTTVKRIWLDSAPCIVNECWNNFPR
jgi:hypothetical protein